MRNGKWMLVYMWSFMFFHLSSWYVIRDSQIWWPHKLNEWSTIMTHQNAFPLTMKLNFGAKKVPQLELKKMKHAAEMHYHCRWQNGNHVKTLQVFRGQGLMQSIPTYFSWTGTLYLWTGKAFISSSVIEVVEALPESRALRVS